MDCRNCKKVPLFRPLSEIQDDIKSRIGKTSPILVKGTAKKFFFNLNSAFSTDTLVELLLDLKMVDYIISCEISLNGGMRKSDFFKIEYAHEEEYKDLYIGIYFSEGALEIDNIPSKIFVVYYTGFYDSSKEICEMLKENKK